MNIYTVLCAKRNKLFVIFDRRLQTKALNWEERLSWTSTDGITVAGC
ncbi:MAG: hypothetical protein LBQ88_21210 [Treponema sp.]|nr:hypothetical protein [Treponema sp.]